MLYSSLSTVYNVNTRIFKEQGLWEKGNNFDVEENESRILEYLLSASHVEMNRHICYNTARCKLHAICIARVQGGSTLSSGDTYFYSSKVWSTLTPFYQQGRLGAWRRIIPDELWASSDMCIMKKPGWELRDVEAMLDRILAESGNATRISYLVKVMDSAQTAVNDSNSNMLGGLF